MQAFSLLLFAKEHFETAITCRSQFGLPGTWADLPIRGMGKNAYVKFDCSPAA